MALVIMLDSNIADDIVCALLKPKMDRLHGAGIARFQKTSAQDSEHAEVNDEAKRSALQDAFAPFERVPPSVFILDAENNLDEARFGGPEDSALYDSIFIGNPKHSNDGIIGATAVRESNVLVTRDTRLKKRLANSDLEVWDFDTFRA